MNTSPWTVGRLLTLNEAELSSQMVALEIQRVWSNPWTVYGDNKRRSTSFQDKSCFMVYKESSSLKVWLKVRRRLCSSTETFDHASERVLLTPHTFNLYDVLRVSRKFHYSHFTGRKIRRERYQRRVRNRYIFFGCEQQKTVDHHKQMCVCECVCVCGCVWWVRACENTWLWVREANNSRAPGSQGKGFL